MHITGVKMIFYIIITCIVLIMAHLLVLKKVRKNIIEDAGRRCEQAEINTMIRYTLIKRK